MQLPEMKSLVGRLNTILNDEDGQGMMSWNMAVGNLMNELVTKWNGVASTTDPDPRRRIFVFGSNTAGRHGRGAAFTAKRSWGAQQYEGRGLHGNSYAIPTKGVDLVDRLFTLTLAEIATYVNVFIEFARTRPDLLFLVTQIGCGLAGHNPYDIAPMFSGAPSNCQFDPAWEGFGLAGWKESPDEYIRNRAA